MLLLDHHRFCLPLVLHDSLISSGSRPSAGDAGPPRQIVIISVKFFYVGILQLCTYPKSLTRIYSLQPLVKLHCGKGPRKVHPTNKYPTLVIAPRCSFPSPPERIFYLSSFLHPTSPPLDLHSFHLTSSSYLLSSRQYRPLLNRSFFPSFFLFFSFAKDCDS